MQGFFLFGIYKKKKKGKEMKNNVQMADVA